MSTSMYQRIWERILKKQIDFSADTIKAMLVSTAYTFDNGHDYVSDVVANEVSGTGYAAGFSGAGRVALTSLTVSLDDTNDWVVFDAADVSWAGINLGATQIGGIILWVPKTNDSDSPLVCYSNDGGFPITTSGGTYTHAWSANGVFRMKHP
jgi:hypothetical protein